MKKSFLLLAIIASFFIISCKNEKAVAEADVPAAVKTAFATKYPGAAVDEWETETKNGKKIYGADFTVNDKEMEAEFDGEGNFVKEK